MAPKTTVVPAVDVAADVWEFKLARKTASSLRQPHKSPKKIVEDLLGRLQSLRHKRDLRGLDHWEEFAPTYLHRMLIRHEALRQRAVEAFFRSERVHALARAKVILGDRCEAEDAVGDAYLKLVAGRAAAKHFYRVLSQVCKDRKRKRRTAAKLFSRERDFELTGAEPASTGPACAGLYDGDPLGILLREEEIREGIKEVKTQRKHQDTRRLKWWRDLLSHHFPEEMQGKQLSETHM